MSLFRRTNPDPRVPLSNRDVAKWVHGHWVELKRARTQHALHRELWHEAKMNEWLDVLCERYRGVQTPTPLV